MGRQATASFEISSWDETSYDEREGMVLSRTRLTKTFSGDVVGESAAELLMARTEVEGSAAYVGFERVVGSVHGRAGSFVLHHSASGSRGESSMALSVVPDSGTGALVGLRGEGAIVAEPGGGHLFTLDYELDG